MSTAVAANLMLTSPSSTVGRPGLKLLSAYSMVPVSSVNTIAASNTVDDTFTKASVALTRRFAASQPMLEQFSSGSILATSLLATSYRRPQPLAGFPLRSPSDSSRLNFMSVCGTKSAPVLAGLAVEYFKRGALLTVPGA
jgi:hypothetical protein